MKCVHVVWIDSETQHGWEEISSIDSSVEYAHTVGFLVMQDVNFVLIALSYDPANKSINGRIHIPVKAIKEMRTLCQIKI